jgi:hypothetical protein
VEVGWMWQDADKNRTLEEKVELAARRYQEKHERQANVCFVNPAHLNGDECLRVNGVLVLPRKNIMPHYFWLGVEEQVSNLDT